MSTKLIPKAPRPRPRRTRPQRPLRSASSACRIVKPAIAASLAPERRQLQAPEELHLVLELDAEPFERPPPRLRDQREGVGRRRVARVLDEVRVARRDHGAAHAVALQAARLEQVPGAELVLRVLEDGAERAPVRRLSRLPA